MQHSRLFNITFLCLLGLIISQVFFACLSTTDSSEQTTSTTISAVEPTTSTSTTIVSTEVPLIKTPIQVSQAVFAKTFSEVEALIAELNIIIRTRNYEGWTTHLSPEYLTRMSNIQVLQDLSASPILKRNEIVLHSLADYFKYVVVPSRNNVKLDDLVFLSESEVEAIMMRDSKRVTVYRLININGQWKIGL